MTDKKELIEFQGLMIDTIIFRQGFVPGCDIGICGGQCCDWGVYMDRDFQSVILKHETKILESMDEYQPKDKAKWFEKELVRDGDFPSGFALGTEIYVTSKGTTQCVFKDKHNYCSLQVSAMKNGEHKWNIKPKYCILYPLTVVDNILTYDDEHSKKLDYCGADKEHNFTQTVFEAMTEEIKYVFGEECFDFLEKYFIKNYKKKYQIENLKIKEGTNG